MYFTDTQQKCWDILCDLDGETVAKLLTDYHGNCLLDDGFLEFLEDEVDCNLKEWEKFKSNSHNIVGLGY